MPAQPPTTADSGPAPGPRHCTFCGARIPDSASICPSCDPLARSPMENPTGYLDINTSTEPSHHFGPSSSLVLYGLLLAASAASSLLPFGDDAELRRTLFFDGLLILIVSFTAAQSWGVVAGGLPGGLRLKHLPIAIGAAAGTLATAFLYGWAISPILPAGGPGLVAALGLGDQTAMIQVAIIAATPAVFEELAFRGMILPYLASRMPVAQAVVVSSAAFAILHLNPPFLPLHFAMGLAFGWLRVSSRSLVPPMVAHFVHNGLLWALEAAS